ncbi:hypothetical protein V1292_004846 [Bradyrhizobium sp. AZCC 1719]|uniref:hypothetical protein n=1 Tax=Bradyrhizobium sp. AZCC 1719 TaxID=3117028 RepID=UPI002FF08EA7
MTSGQDIIGIVSRRTGIDLGIVEQVADNLTQSGAWPDDPNRALTFLLLALSANAEPRSAASVAKHHWQLESDSGKPLGQMIEDILHSFLEQQRTDFSAIAYRAAFEIYDTTTPKAVLRIPCVNRAAEITYGGDEEAWKDRTVRRSNFLTGKTLFDICADINLQGRETYVY